MNTPRPRKYRAWIKAEQRMCSVVALHIMDRCVEVVEVHDAWVTDFLTGEKDQQTKTYPIDEVDLMESVGVRDKSGREIWEHDVDKNGWVVAWCNGQDEFLGASIGWYIQRRQFEQEWYYSAPLTCSGSLYQTHKDDCVNIEIAGNIHENPDLLTIEPWKAPEAYWDNEHGYAGKDGSIYDHIAREVQP